MEISAPSHLPQHQRNKVLSFQDHLVNLVVFAVSQVTKTNKTIAEIEASVRRKVNTMSQEQISALLNPTETGYGVHLESFEAPDGKLYHQFGL